MKTILALALGIFLLVGCAAPKKEIVAIKQNRFFRCEPSRTIEKKMVRLINNARSSKRRCGFRRCPAVKPVRWNSKLAKAALNHSMDMAKNDILSHTGSDRSDVGKRVKEVGYAWIAVGENISAGRETSEQVVLVWLSSPDHCANIMKAAFTDIGAACFRNRSSKYGTYWTLVLASPKN